MLESEESKKQCYVLVNGQIKFDPAWLTQKDKFVNDGLPKNKFIA